MKRICLMLLVMGLVSVSSALEYGFDADAEGFSSVAWMAGGTVQQTHTAGGWQMMMTKEFSWEAGGGAANQQLAMQAIANDPLAKISFDVMVDGASFPAGAQTWYQFIVVGNSDGAAGWTQTQLLDSWHNADDPTLITWHFDLALAQLGWQPGDSWFQLWTGSNSDGAVPVNFYLDNVVVTPEPATMTMLALGALALLRKK